MVSSIGVVGTGGVLFVAVLGRGRVVRKYGVVYNRVGSAIVTGVVCLGLRVIFSRFIEELVVRAVVVLEAWVGGYIYR